MGNSGLKYGLLWGLLAFFQALAQTNSIPIQRYSIEHGMSSRQANKCLKDKRGFLWIGTNDGLNRFDGSHFKIYRHIPNDSNSLSGNVVVNLAEDKHGNIWVITTAGLCRFDVAENRFRQFRFPWMTPEKRQYTLEPGLLLDEDKLWFSDYDGVNVLNLNGQLLHRYRYEAPYKGRLTIFLGKDAQNQIYAGSIEGTFQLDEKVKLLRRMNLPIPDAAGLSLSNDSRGKTWLTRWATGATEYDPQTGEVKQVGQHESLRQVFELKPDSFWACGDYQGLLNFSRKDRRFRHITSFYNLETGLEESFTVNSINSFGDGYIWLCTWEGLVRISRKPKPFSILKATDLGLNVPANFIGVRQDPDQPYQLWINSWYQNLIRYRKDSKTFDKVFDERHQSAIGLPWVNAYSLITIDDELWAVGHFGLQKRPKGSQQFERLLPPGRDSSFLHQPCNSIKKLKNGRFLVVSSGKGLVEFSRDFSFYREYPFQLNDLLGWDMRYGSMLELDSTQYLLCSDKSGLIRFNYPNKTFTRLAADRGGKPFPNFIRSLAKEKNGNIWVASLEGLVVLDRDLNRLFEFSAQNGLPASRIYQVLVDKQNRVWAATGEGLALWQPDHQTFRVFTKSDGLPDNQPDRLFLMENGNLVSGHDNGLAFLQPQYFDNRPKAPGILISDVLFENKEIAFAKEKELVVPPQVAQIEFWFSALEYGKPEGMRYAYQVEEISPNWVDIGTRHRVSFFQLPPGDYTLRVKAISALGVASKEPATLHFTVKAPYYKTWWFRLLLVALVVGLVVAFYRYRIQQLLKLERVRMRISRDLHDDIGSTLSSINILTRSAKRRFEEKDDSRLAESLEKIGERTQAMLENMNDIIWSVKPENDSLDRVASRMREFAANVLEARNMDFKIDFDTHLEKYQLPLEAKNNLFLIFKEAVNNVAKYSQCTWVDLTMKVDSGKLVLEINDNGIGFDPNKKRDSADSTYQKGGNGLRNMAQRAQEMGAEFFLQSAEGQGTLVRLILPL